MEIVPASERRKKLAIPEKASSTRLHGRLFDQDVAEIDGLAWLHAKFLAEPDRPLAVVSERRPIADAIRRAGISAGNDIRP